MRTRQIQITRITVALFVLAGCLFFLASRAGATPPFNGRIAFVSLRTGNDEIFSMNQDGTDQVNLSNNSASDNSPSWSPDGKKIAFDSNRDGNLEIYVMNADGSNPIRLTSDPSTDFDPSWSPDGTKIAFVSFRDGNFEIYVMNADGTNQVRLTFNTNTDPDVDPSWSPDGTKIAFASRRDGNLEIYVMNADGTNQTRLTNDPTIDQDPAFSPDGTKIVFYRQVGGPVQILTMNADGANPVQLTSVGSNLKPAFSPDGTKITFASFRDGNAEIYVMNSNGANQVRLTNNSAGDQDPSWQPILAPDTIGLYRPSTSAFPERFTNTSGRPNTIVDFGQAGDLPIAGDWNGDRISDVGVFRNGQFLLRQPIVVNLPGQPSTTIIGTITVNFGQAGDLPVVGDWNGDGKDTPGVFRNGQWLLTNSPNTNNSSPPADLTFGFGLAGDKPVAGDWNGDGIDTIGTFNAGSWALRNSNSTGAADITVAAFGTPAGVRPVVGDWNGDGIDTIGVFAPSNVAGSATFFLDNNANPTGSFDIQAAFGADGDIPVAGVWNKPPNSGVNDPSDGTSSVGQVQQFITTCSDIDGWHNIATIDFKIAKSSSNGNGNGVPIALWVQFDEDNNLIHFYDPDSQFWSSGAPGSFGVLSSRLAELHLAQTSVHGSGPNGRSVNITWSIVFKDAAVMTNYKQFLLITDDSGFNTGFDKVGSWSVIR